MKNRRTIRKLKNRLKLIQMIILGPVLLMEKMGNLFNDEILVTDGVKFN